MLSAASCRSCGEAKGPCGFGSSHEWKRARANKPATCKACALDAENAAPQAVDKAAVLASCGMLSLFIGNCLAEAAPKLCLAGSLSSGANWQVRTPLSRLGACHSVFSVLATSSAALGHLRKC